MVAKPAKRIASIDAFRGFVMLAMVSGGFAVARTVDAHPELLEGPRGHWWELAAYQLSHVPWAGCAFWDLIQPSFMFLVGVSLPFSTRAREAKGASKFGLFFHALWRSLVLIALGIILSSQSAGFLNITLVNVLTQIGLGYMVLFVLRDCGVKALLAVIAILLIGYGLAFFQHAPSEGLKEQLAEYLQERTDLPPEDMQQYTDHRRHWNKHTNAAAAWDRWFLNLFPRNEEPWTGRSFWVNRGGYQTLNFVPSIGTMLFGLIAGLILIGDDSKSRRVLKLLGFSAGCFVVAFLLDTELWPMSIGTNWSACPIVKRIWTPTWTIFSAGWTFAMLAAFYAVIDGIGLRFWSWPLMIVGMNSITMYVLAQLTKGWFSRMLGNTLRTIDGMAGTEFAAVLYGDGTYAMIYHSIAVLTMLWLVCLWMYRRRLFIRI